MYVQMHVQIGEPARVPVWILKTPDAEKLAWLTWSLEGSKVVALVQKKLKTADAAAALDKKATETGNKRPEESEEEQQLAAPVTPQAWTDAAKDAEMRETEQKNDADANPPEPEPSSPKPNIGARTGHTPRRGGKATAAKAKGKAKKTPKDKPVKEQAKAKAKAKAKLAGRKGASKGASTSAAQEPFQLTIGLGARHRAHVHMLRVAIYPCTMHMCIVCILHTCTLSALLIQVGDHEPLED